MHEKDTEGGDGFFLVYSTVKWPGIRQTLPVSPHSLADALHAGDDTLCSGNLAWRLFIMVVRPGHHSVKPTHDASADDLNDESITTFSWYTAQPSLRKRTYAGFVIEIVAGQNIEHNLLKV